MRTAPTLLAIAAVVFAPLRARAITGDEAVQRARDWVNAGMPYCQVPYGGCDSHVCCGPGYRPENPDWDPYRSDCSGMVSWTWDLGGPGRVTTGFAPFDTSVSYEIDATQLQPGDAINSSEHIMLFAGWVSYLTTADLIDESDWGYPAQERQINVTVNGSTVTRDDWTSNPFTAIRYIRIAPPNQAPTGWLDAVDCDSARGWSQDPDVPNDAINVDVYFGGAAGSGAPGTRTLAGNDRSDLCSAIGSCNHGFSLRTPRSLEDGQAHEVHAYGIDSAGGNNPELSGSPQSLTCAPTESGVRRHVVDPASFGGWKFDAFMDVRPVDDATFNGWSAAADWPAQPQLVQASGDPAVWLIDGAFRRHIASPDVMDAWRFDWNSIQAIDATQLAAMPQGPDVRSRPQLVQGSGPEVDVLDDALPVLDPPDAGSASSTSGSSSGSTTGSVGTSTSSGGTTGGVSPVDDGGAPALQVASSGAPSGDGRAVAAKDPSVRGGCQGGPGGFGLWATLAAALAWAGRRRSGQTPV